MLLLQMHAAALSLLVADASHTLRLKLKLLQQMYVAALSLLVADAEVKAEAAAANVRSGAVAARC
jgi:hypothetical protein